MNPGRGSLILTSQIFPAIDLGEILTLDGIDLLPEQSFPRIRSHDLHGALPKIILSVDVGDRLGLFERLNEEVVKLCTKVRFRRELADTFEGASFLPPTKLERRCVAGIQWEGRTVVVEALDFMGAYQTL